MVSVPRACSRAGTRFAHASRGVGKCRWELAYGSRANPQSTALPLARVHCHPAQRANLVGPVVMRQVHQSLVQSLLVIPLVCFRASQSEVAGGGLATFA